MEKNKYIGLVTFVVLSLLVLPGLMATTTLTTPTAGGNYTTLTVDCTTTLNSSETSYNVSVWYNATGGETSGATMLVAITNTSADQGQFTSAVSIEALSDLATYNFSCYADNLSDQEWSTAAGTVTIDNTAPTRDLIVQLSGDSTSYGSLLDYSCGLGDAMDSTLATQSFSVAHPDGDDVSSTTLERNSADFRQFTDTDYVGDFIFTCSATDSAGNVGTSTATVTVDSLGNLSVKNGTSNNNTIIIVIILLVLAFVMFKKK